MSKAMEVNEANFEQEVIKSEIPVVIDCWAIWCGPCLALGPTIDEMAVEFEGRAKITKLDVDSNQSLAMKYGIRSIPAILFIKNGELVNQVVGAVPKKVLVDKLTPLL